MTRLDNGRYSVMLRVDYLHELVKVPGKSRDVRIQEAISEMLDLPKDTIIQEIEKQGVEYTSWTAEKRADTDNDRLPTHVHEVYIPDELVGKLQPYDEHGNRLDAVINAAIRLWLQKQDVGGLEP